MKFDTIESKTVALPIDNIDTDQIIPARFLKTTSMEGLGDNLFLDWRYLANADVLGLHIPTLRRFMAEGDVADGVLGEYPTLTWPSHTTMCRRACLAA